MGGGNGVVKFGRDTERLLKTQTLRARRHTIPTVVGRGYHCAL